MFGKLASMMHQAAEALAPTVSSKDEFIQSWKGITTQLIESKDERQPVQSTKIPRQLERMLTLLRKEDKQYEENTGPCLEYLLQHKILETLHTLGRGNTPPGMKQQVLTFFSQMLDSVRHPLLPQVHVHKPVQRLIKCCGVTASPTESEEVDFLLALCRKFRKEPSLVNFFIETYGTVSPGPDQASKPSLKFDLLTALLQLSKSVDYSVALKAYEGLIVCTSLPQESAAVAITTNSTYCQQVVRRLVDRYKDLPICQDCTELYSVTAKWGLDDLLQQGANPLESTDVTKFRQFFTWLDYINSVLLTAHPFIADKLVKGLSDMFMNRCLLTLLLHPREDYILATTNYLTRILQMISAPSLVHEFAVFLLGTDTNPEVRHPPTVNHKLRHALIQHCDHVSEQLSMSTLRLFGALLTLPTEHVIDNLVLRNLHNRCYHASPIQSDLLYLPKDKLLTDYAIRTGSSTPKASNGICNGGIGDGKRTGLLVDLGDLSQMSTPFSSPLESPAWLPSTPKSFPSSTVSPLQSPGTESRRWSLSSASAQQHLQTSFNASWSSLDTSNPAIGSRDSTLRELACMRIVCDPSSLQTTVNGFLDIVPSDLHSPSVETGNTRYEAYLHDASVQVDQCNRRCNGWMWDASIETGLTTVSRSSFYEGTFLDIAFNMVLRMLDQPYSMNLQLTSLLSQLAMFPHPFLHEYLLDASIPLVPGARSLYSVLVKVRDDLVVRMQRMPHFVSALMEARRRLTGQGTVDLISMPNNTLFEGVVVLEEFCKEISAITFAKSAIALQDSS